MMIDSRLLVGAAALCAAISMSAEAKLYKWVDENGTTHYGETIPPEYADKDAMKLEKGILKKRDSEDTKKGTQKKVEDVDPVAEKARIEAQRRDNALLNTYSNEKEIDLARNRNLLQVEARVNGYATMLKSAQATLDSLLQEKDAISKNGRNIPASLTQDIAAAEALVAKRQKELNTSNKEVEAVKARYEADKQRFRELKGVSPGAK
jgi:hypothetical protein